MQGPVDESRSLECPWSLNYKHWEILLNSTSEILKKLNIFDLVVYCHADITHDILLTIRIERTSIFMRFIPHHTLITFESKFTKSSKLYSGMGMIPSWLKISKHNRTPKSVLCIRADFVVNPLYFWKLTFFEQSFWLDHTPITYPERIFYNYIFTF